MKILQHKKFWLVPLDDDIEYYLTKIGANIYVEDIEHFKNVFNLNNNNGFVYIGVNSSYELLSGSIKTCDYMPYNEGRGSKSFLEDNYKFMGNIKIFLRKEKLNKLNGR